MSIYLCCPSVCFSYESVWFFFESAVPDTALLSMSWLKERSWHPRLPIGNLHPAGSVGAGNSAMPSSCWVVVYVEARAFLTAWDSDGTHSRWLSHPGIGEELIVLNRDEVGWIRVISKGAWLGRLAVIPRWIHPEVVRPMRHDCRIYTLAADSLPSEPHLPCLDMRGMMHAYAAPSYAERKHLGRCVHCTTRLWRLYPAECNFALNWALDHIMNGKNSVNLRCKAGKHRTTCIANAAWTISGAEWVPHMHRRMCRQEGCLAASRDEVLALGGYRAVTDLADVLRFVWLNRR